MINASSISIKDYLNCGTIYAREGIARILKAKDIIKADNDVDDIISNALLTEEILEVEKNGYWYGCNNAFKAKMDISQPEKKTTGGKVIDFTKVNGQHKQESNPEPESEVQTETQKEDPTLEKLLEAERRAKEQKVNVLVSLLNQVERVDFYALAGKDPEEGKLSYKHIAVLVCEEISSLAITNNWSLCKRDGFFWVFDGTHYYKIEDAELEAFLGKCAEKMGVERLESRSFGFKETLRKQFASSGYLPPLAEPNAIPKINLSNGTLTFPQNSTPQLKDFDKDDFLTYQLNFPYQPEADCPIFSRFLDEVLPDKSLQMVLCEMLAYVFVRTRHLKLEKCLLLYGFGANGKSVVFEVFTALLGVENTVGYTLSSLCEQNGYHRALLAGKLVNYASEISGDLNSQVFKTLASGEPCDARLPYKEPFLLREYAKLIFNTNVLPNAPEHTHGFFRRFCIIPFEVTIPEEKQDKDLPAKIISKELPGVLNWLIQGLERLLKNRKLTYSAKINEQSEKFKKDSDSAALFLDDLPEEGYEKLAEAEVAFKELYQAYAGWSKNSGYKALSKRKFGERIRALGYKVDKNSDKGMYVFGIGFRPINMANSKAEPTPF